MKIKTKRILCIILMLLPTLYTAALLPFLPEKIPAHYGFDGNIDRFGSKFESFILPLCIIFIGLFMFIIAWFSQDSESESKNNEGITLTVSLCTLIIFNAMQLFFLYIYANSVFSLNSAKIDLYSLMCCLFGAMLIVIGNINPKIKMNSMLGLRTKHSMKNETTWRYSQRFAGYASIICGLIMLIGCWAFMRGTAALCFSAVLLMIMTIADCLYAYIASTKF